MTKNFDYIFTNILKSFINSKIIFKKIFEKNGNDVITDIDNFINIYKNIVTINNKYQGFNMLIKLYNEENNEENNEDNNEKFIYMKKNTLIKINNVDNFKIIDKTLSNDKIFLGNNKSNYYIGYGNKFNSDINSQQIKNIFFNKVNMNNEKINKNYEMFCKFKKISFIYWISTPLVFE